MWTDIARPGPSRPKPDCCTALRLGHESHYSDGGKGEGNATWLIVVFVAVAAARWTVERGRSERASETKEAR